MEAINSAQVPLVEIETMERPLDYDDEPFYLFKGIIVGGFFSLLFWAVIFGVII